VLQVPSPACLLARPSSVDEHWVEMNFLPAFINVPCSISVTRAQQPWTSVFEPFPFRRIKGFLCYSFFYLFRIFLRGIVLFLAFNLLDTISWLLHRSLSLQKLIYLLSWMNIPLHSTSVTMSPDDLCLSQISFCDRPKMLE
jgi:hypothetical protein